MKILTDHFLFFGDIFRDMPPKVRSKRHLERLFERLSSDPSTDARTPSIPSHHGHFPYFSKMVGKNFILVLLTTLVPGYAWLFSRTNIIFIRP